MRAIHAIFDRGQVDFVFDYPEMEGPVPVLVIFPDDRDELPPDESGDLNFKGDSPWREW